MVLEPHLRMMKVLILVLLGSVFLFFQFPETTDSCTIDGVQLKLIDQGGKSVLKINNKKKETVETLKIKPPCYFLRSEKEVQSYSYKEVNTKVIIITGAIMDKRTQEYMGAPAHMVCGTKAQGILFRNDSIIVTDTLLHGGIICKDEGLDEKDFWTLAHRKGFGRK